jgi:hypothetical protein
VTAWVTVAYQPIELSLSGITAFTSVSFSVDNGLNSELVTWAKRSWFNLVVWTVGSIM